MCREAQIFNCKCAVGVIVVIFDFEIVQGRPCTWDIALWHVCTTTVATEMHFMCIVELHVC
jgi:hypothetical protein